MLNGDIYMFERSEGTVYGHISRWGCILTTCNASDDNQKTAPLHGQMMATARLSYIFEYIEKVRGDSLVDAATWGK